MKKPDKNLLEKRAELKQTINQGMEITFPAYLYNALGKGLVKVFRLKKVPHWAFSAFVLYVLLLLPGPLIAWVTDEIYEWGKLELILYGTTAFLYLGSVAAYVNFEYNILPSIRDYIVDALQTVDSVKRLDEWFSPLISIPKWSIFFVGSGLFYALVLSMFETRAAGRSIGIGLIVGNFLFGSVLNIGLYIILRMLTFPIELANCQLHIYESDPANSEVVQRLTYFLTVHIYIIAGYFAIGTMLGALIPELSWTIWLYISLGWLPTIIQFLVNQYAIRKIIIGAKWQNLNRLQIRIGELQNDVLTDASDKAIIQLNQLMDLHDRISAKPNSALNWGTGLSFLNQLLLPLLGLLLGNIDKFLKLLARTP